MKVGDYVRNCYGRIAKIEYIEDDIAYCDNWLTQQYEEHIDFINLKDKEDLDEIIKSSPNIIDLIEVGDLVKIEFYSLRYNERVTRLFEVTFKDGEYINLSNAKCEFMLVNGEFNKGDKELNPIIKSIVTKKQFESMEYKVKE